MAKTLTAATIAQKDAYAATPLNILEIQFGGAIGTKYYADRDLAVPVSAEGRVISWGNFALEALEESGRISDATVELADTDRVLLGYTRSQETQHKPVYLWQFYSGLAWLADRVLLLKGTIKQPVWREEPPSLSLEIENIESRWDGKIGTEATKTIFPAIKKEHEGRLLPLVYGRVERLEPVQVIDAKRTTLVLPLSKTATIAIVSDSRDFLQGAANLYNLYIGREYVKGWFLGGKLQLTNRGLVLATGYTTGAPPNLMTFKATLSPAGPSWIGLKIRFWIGSYQVERQITNYVSPDIYGMDVWLHVPGSTYYEIHGAQVNHDAGETVQEKISNYTWITNDAPSTALEYLEIETSIIMSGAGVSNTIKNLTTIAKMDARYYTVNLNDATWVGSLGHNVTSIVMAFDPQDLPNTPYAGDFTATLTGINTSNPVALIVAMGQLLGMVYPTDFDTTSETAVTTSTGWMSLGFGLAEKKKLEVLFEIAFQSRISLAFEEGKLYFRYLENKTGTSALTIANTHREIDSIEISRQDVREIINKVVAAFRDRGIEREIVSEDSGSIAKFGERERRLNFWAHNNRAYAAAIATFWLRRWCNATEHAQVRTFLTSLNVQRYDWITLNDGTYYVSQKVQVLKVEHNPGAGETEEIDRIELAVKVPKFAGCASSCELYEETGCASTCQQCCQSSAETACGYACETAAQDACSLSCVSTCMLECTTYLEMSQGCSLSCQQNCTAQCETGCTSAGCQTSGCTASCTISCQVNACEVSCQVACEAGACQLACEAATQTSCADSCEMDAQTGACLTSCQQGCQSGCTTSSCQTGGCEATACQTGGCEATACQACCQHACTAGCRSYCQQGSCRAGCTASVQGSGSTSCSSDCEISCRASCEGHCQSCCQYDGTETSYQCQEYCQTASCMQNCQTSMQSTGGGIGACITACQTYCMTASETGCGTYCTVGCLCYCQVSCEQDCRTGSCQTNCECQCQTAAQSAACSTGSEGACYSSCTVYEETGCATGCQTGCQSFCRLFGCTAGCEIFCTGGCQCNCQANCQASCRSDTCETVCQCSCRTVATISSSTCDNCQAACTTAVALCYTTCQATCTTLCRSYCQTACTTSLCMTGCQSWCMTSGCTAGCEIFCTIGCQCNCQANCQASCRSNTCETVCQCSCRTAAQV